MEARRVTGDRHRLAVLHAFHLESELCNLCYVDCSIIIDSPNSRVIDSTKKN
jgi:hypothetical protein